MQKKVIKTYTQKLGKIKWNLGRRYNTQKGKIIPEKFFKIQIANVDDCLEDYKQQENVFLKCSVIWETLISKMYCYTWRPNVL